MKKTIKLLGLTAVVLLSACGTSNIALLKRKYNSGYCVDFGNKKFITPTNNIIVSTKPQNNKTNNCELKKETNAEKTNDGECITKTEQQNIDYPYTASTDNKIFVSSKKKNFKTIIS